MHKIIIKIAAMIEMLIGLSTFLVLMLSLFGIFPKKPLNVFIFVFLSSIISIAIGAGLLVYREWARRTLVFFSAYIILTKLLIFSGLLNFSGEALTFIPGEIKNFTSIIYHGTIFVFFTLPVIKEMFNGHKTGR